MCKVSVIIPMYNVENYLRECLESVMNQTLQNIEVICVDDGSLDRSAEVAQEYVEKYDNVKLIRKNNGGQSSSRNLALKYAQGEYIYFLDSDDYIDPHTLEELCDKADFHGLDIVFFNAVPFFENDEIRSKNERYITYYSRKKEYPDICTGQSMFVKMRNNRDFFESPCLELFRRSLLEENNLRFYEGIIHEDILFTFQCVMLAQKVGYINRYYYYRRVHDDSTMTKPKSIRNVEGYIVSYSEAVAFLRNISVEEHAAPVIVEYLYSALYRNAWNLWNKLDDAEKNKPLRHGGVVAEHFLYSARNAAQAELHANRLKRENCILTRRQSSFKEYLSYRVKARCKWMKKKVKGFKRHVSKYGYKSVFRKVSQKVSRAFAGLINRHSSGKIKKFFGWAQKYGYRYALRRFSVKVYQKFGVKAPQISFVLPVYNVEEFLPQCLDTLIRQTMPRIEIICVDDGSTDRSLAILYEYAAKDHRIKVFTQKNQFAGAARNLGLSKAAGEYVIFLDSDDFFEKKLADTAYAAAKANDADIVIYNARFFDNVTKKTREAKWLLEKSFVPRNQPFNRNDCPDHLFQITTPAPWTKMFRRKFVLDAGLQFQKLRNSNDLFFTYSALAEAERIVTVDKPLVNYRVGLTQNLQSTKKKDPLCFFSACQAMHDRLTERGTMDTLRRSYVNAALNNCIYNFNSVSDPEAKRQIYEKLRTDGFEQLEVLGYNSDYYINQNRYQQMKRIMMAAVNEKPSLSVIIPVYNVEPYVRECLESVINSNWANLEIVCVNDCSTDRSLDILEEYAARDSRIQVINKEKNEGPLMARKTGALAATKEHIIFLDADDYLSTEIYEFIYNTVMFEAADIIQFTIGVEDYSGDGPKVNWLKRALRPQNIAYSEEQILIEAFVTRSYSTSLLGKIFKAELCRNAFALLPNEYWRVGEDIFTFFFLAYFAKSYVGINSKEYYIYRYGLGVTNNANMSLEKFELYCKMACLCQNVHDILLTKNPVSAAIDAYDAMVSRMFEDCCRIYQSRIAEIDMEEAIHMLIRYWSLFPTVQEAAQNILGIQLENSLK